MTIIFTLLASDQKDQLLSLYGWHLQDDVNDPLEEFTAACFTKWPARTDSEKIVNLRHCVNMDSAFSVDKKNYSKWRDFAAMMRWLRDYNGKKATEPPPMECFYRAQTLSRGLKILGYQSRTVTITSNADNLMDHVVVRVKNPDTQHWEIQDPLYDIKYVSKKDGHTMGLRQALTYDFNDFQPCDFQGKCGWDLVSREKFDVVKMKNYLSSGYDSQDKILYLSRDFNENELYDVYGKEMTFCQKRPEFCEHIIYLKPKNQLFGTK